VSVPDQSGIVQELGKLREPRSFERRSSTPAAFGRSRGKQIGVKPQAGDHTYVRADSRKKFESRESAVGDDDDAAIGQPAVDLQDRLPRPVDQRFGGARLTLVKAFGRREQGEERQSHDAPGPRHGDEQHGA
jgi:hypothetical protein